MKTLFRTLAIVALVGAFLMLPDRVSSVPFASLTMAGAAGAPHVPGEVLVKFRPTATTQDRTVSLAAQGHSMRADLDQSGWVRVKVSAGQTVAEALVAYQDDPNVEYVQPNYIYSISQAPNDPDYGQLWAFTNSGQAINNTFTQPPLSSLTYTFNNPGTPGEDMNIEKAWDHFTDCNSVVVAVVDSGVNYNHTDLAGNMWNGGATYPNHGYNYVNSNNDPMDLNGHGTHVAGIIGAVGNNAVGTTGVCWKASIMAVRVLGASGSGTTSNIILGINFAVANGAKVINLSLGGGSFDQAFSDAITAAQAADVVAVVAAGNAGVNNDSGTAPTYPCNFTQPNLICVAALDQGFQLAKFSNYGATSVDVGAPGTNILSTWAGTNTVLTDPLNAGWTMTTTKTGGWVVDSTIFGSPALIDPSNWLSGTYTLNTDDRVYKSFDLSGADGVALRTYAYVNVTSDGSFAVADSASGGDPFAVASPKYVWGPYYTDRTPATSPSLHAISADISSCNTTSCTLGFKLKTGATADLGAAVPYVSISKLALNATSYNTINGTSMATPEVAGLATMLRAYNPQFTYADVVSAIKNGGRQTASLAGKTTAGRAIDVMSSLAYINPPTGLSYIVQ